MATMTAAQAKKLGITAKGQAEPNARQAAMNKTEARYAQRLESLQLAGVIAWYAFEPIKLRLADRSWYTPDFLVMLPSGELELHEVKGRKSRQHQADTFYATEDSRLKVRFVAEKYPFPVVIVWPQSKKGGGGWDSERYE